MHLPSSLKMSSTNFLISGSNRLGFASWSESSNNMHGFLVFDSRLSSKWQNIKRLQWLQQTIGTKTYFFENICLSLIHFRTFLLWAAFKYKLNHKQSRYVNWTFFSSGELLHSFWKQYSKALESSFPFRIGIVPLGPTFLVGCLRRRTGQVPDVEGDTSWKLLTFSDSCNSFLLPCPVVGCSTSINITGCWRFRLPIDCDASQVRTPPILFLSRRRWRRALPGCAKFGGGGSESFL